MGYTQGRGRMGRFALGLVKLATARPLWHRSRPDRAVREWGLFSGACRIRGEPWEKFRNPLNILVLPV